MRQLTAMHERGPSGTACSGLAHHPWPALELVGRRRSRGVPTNHRLARCFGDRFRFTDLRRCLGRLRCWLGLASLGRPLRHGFLFAELGLLLGAARASWASSASLRSGLARRAPEAQPLGDPAQSRSRCSRSPAPFGRMTATALGVASPTPLGGRQVCPHRCCVALGSLDPRNTGTPGRARDRLHRG